MPSGNSGATELKNHPHEKPDVRKNDEKGSEERNVTSRTENANEEDEIEKGKSQEGDIQEGENISSLPEIKTEKAKTNLSSQGSMEASINSSRKTSRVDTIVSTKDGGTTSEVKSDTTASSTKGSVLPKTGSNQSSIPVSKPTEVPSGNAPVILIETQTDPKIDSNAIHTRKETTEHNVTKPIVKTTAAAPVMAPKQLQQSSHSKPHTQQQRYSIPSRHNQEEAVFKMVQNIFKLLETRGPLTMAQLEYNLPIMISGSPSSLLLTPQPMNATTSKINPTPLDVDPTVVGESDKDAIDATTARTAKTKKAPSTTSIYEEKLIPGNMVPDIVELLVTLGIIQQQMSIDEVSSNALPGGANVSEGSQKRETVKTKDQLKKQPRFAVHFGKPKQFLVTPINILSEIAKAQAEIQLSRNRQELLKEALNMADEQAAERVKQIVLQHPQVVDDPVYVTALRNLRVDGMLMAGISGNTPAGTSKTSCSQTVGNGVGKPKPGIGRSGKKIGGGKRRQSNGIQVKCKRLKTQKDLVGGTDADSGSRIALTAPSSDIGVSSKQRTPLTMASSTSIADAPSSTHSIKGITPASTNKSENT